MGIVIHHLSRRIGGAFARMIAAVLMTMGSGALAQDYTLQPGDVLGVSILGLPELTTTAAIDTQGYVRFPPFERVMAANDTLENVEATLRNQANGRLVKRIDALGQPAFATVAAEDIVLRVDAYRPIYVTGAVGRPGPVDFRPGISVRAAMATAGGPSRILEEDRSTAALTAAPRLQADYRVLALEHARLQARVWRIEASLDAAKRETPPSVQDLRVSPDVAARLIDLQRRQIIVTDEQMRKAREFLETALEQTAQRLEILNEQERRQTGAVAEDEDELGRVKSLFDRGIVPMDRMLAIRRAQLLSATRLLDTQNDIERVQLEQSRFASDLEKLEDDRVATLLADLEQASGQLREASVRLVAAQEQLEINGLFGFESGSAVAPALTLTIFRSTVGGATQVLAASADDQLVPGDVVEVSLSPIDDVAIQ